MPLPLESWVKVGSVVVEPASGAALSDGRYPLFGFSNMAATWWEPGRTASAMRPMGRPSCQSGRPAVMSFHVTHESVDLKTPAPHMPAYQTFGSAGSTTARLVGVSYWLSGGLASWVNVAPPSVERQIPRSSPPHAGLSCPPYHSVTATRTSWPTALTSPMKQPSNVSPASLDQVAPEFVDL